MSRDRTSSAHVFYDSIVKDPDPVAKIRLLTKPDGPMFETEWLDFKGCEELYKENAKQVDKKVAEIWSKALSAFANTGGGVLLWGIRADKVDGVDCAQGLSLVPNPGELRSRLMELHHQATEPPVVGVEIEHYADSAGAPNGYVVCVIPESTHKPHRTALTGCKEFYIRAGDDFVPCALAVLRALFFPKTSAQISVQIRADWSPAEGANQVKAIFELTVRNDGPGTAEDVVLYIQKDGALDNLKRDSLWNRIDPPGNFGLLSSRPIHPGMSEVAGRLTATGNGIPQMSSAGTSLVPGFDQPIRITVYAKNMESETLAANFSAEDIECRNAVIAS